MDKALACIPEINRSVSEQNPLAQFREYIHYALANVYDQAGMKDSCISELSQVIFWTDSAYREANLPDIYAREAAKLISLTERNASLEKKAIILWWVLSALALIAVAAWIAYLAKQRQARTQHELQLLDSRFESLAQAQTAQAAVMAEGSQLVESLNSALAAHPDDTPLAHDLHKILALYGSHEENRQGLLTVSREIDPRFASRLKADFPRLSEGQLRLAALIAAGVDSGRLASILNISSKSLYTSRYRLRSGLGLSKADSLEEFLRAYATPPRN